MSSQKKNKKSKKGREPSGPSPIDGNICNKNLANSDIRTEIEILKKENEMVKIENKVLKKENEALKNERLEILNENKQLKQVNQKLGGVVEKNGNDENEIPQNSVMEIEHISYIGDTHGSTISMLKNSARQQTAYAGTSDNSNCLPSTSTVKDMHLASSRRVSDDKSGSEPSKCWYSENEGEQGVASGYAENVTERAWEQNYDIPHGGKEAWKNQSRNDRQQRQKTEWNKHDNKGGNDEQTDIRGRRGWNKPSNKTYDKKDGNDEQSNFRGRGGNELNYYRRQRGGPDFRQQDRSDRGENERPFVREGNQQRYNKNKERFSKVNIIELDGDLFSAPGDYALAHCVAADLRMGSGIAVQFKQQFGNVDELMDQRKKVGQVAVLEEEGRYIYYLITKKYSTGKPRLCDLQKSLEDMKKHVEINQVKNIAVPRLGCGLDRLSWRDVRQLLRDVFEDVDVTITVYNFTIEMQNSSDHPPKKSSIFTVDKLMRLVNIARGTLLVLFGSECGYVDKTMDELDEKFRFINDYKAKPKKLGDVLELEKLGEIICILIVKNHKNSLMSYPALQKCLVQLRKIARKHKFIYLGFSAFMDGDDELTVAKIVTLLKAMFTNTNETWICWPDEMKSVYEEYTQGMSLYKEG